MRTSWPKRYKPRAKPTIRRTQAQMKEAQESSAEKRAQILKEFEMTLAAQMVRINNRFVCSDTRVRQANKHTRDNGPLITEGGTALAYRGDDVDVEIKK